MAADDVKVEKVEKTVEEKDKELVITQPLVILRRIYTIKLDALGYGNRGIPGDRNKAVMAARKHLNRLEVEMFTSKGVQIGDYFVEELDLMTDEELDEEDTEEEEK